MRNYDPKGEAIAITFDLPTVEPEDSLRIGDEHLDTILETKSDEFIKSSVENLVPNLSESEDLSNSECDVPAYDDFTTLSNLLFDDDDFSSSDDESFSNEDISKEIYSNPIFDEEIISIDSLLDVFGGELILSKSIPPGIDETNYDPEEEICQIDLSFTLDDSMPSGIEDDNYDSEGDGLIHEELLSNNSLSLPENKSFQFNIPSSPRPPAKPPDDDEIEPNSEILIVKLEKSPHLLSHRGLKAFQLHSEIPMTIYGGNTPILDVPFLHFYPS
uniref:Reverse transcriptase domain-containing protein n=1 Tax=Tanacetum cinerariifolium TaxID=118510 RepID=A0A6L2M1I0_TANCI|nr:hypothetical protein [Tanacetum cinerariifolium]